MVSVNRSLRNFLMVSSALLLTGGIYSAAFADEPATLPPPPPDEDTPKPAQYDPGQYIKTYNKRTSVTVKTRKEEAPQVVNTGSTTTATTTQAGPTTTTTSTLQATPTPAVTTTTRTSQTTTTKTENVTYGPTNAAAQVLLNKAYAQMKRNDFVGAVASLNDAVKADANSVVARRYLAYSLLRIARPGEALNQLVVLTNMLKPNQPTTFDTFNLGECYLTLRNFNAAEEAFKTVIAAEPRNDSARGDLIKAYAYDQKYPEAMQQLSIGQQNRNPAIQRYYRSLLELVYNAKTASTVGSAPSAVTPETNTWQQISPK